VPDDVGNPVPEDVGSVVPEEVGNGDEVGDENDVPLLVIATSVSGRS